jgi:hypothetical protein
MENSIDELMEEPSLPQIYEAFFQFNEEDPIRFAFVAGSEFSLVLKTDNEAEDPCVEFADGKGKSFKLFLKKSDDELQQEILQHGDAS